MRIEDYCCNPYKDESRDGMLKWRVSIHVFPPMLAKFIQNAPFQIWYR